MIGVHQNLTFPVQPDPVSGMHCWHQRVTLEKAGPGDRYGDIFVDTGKAHEVYKEWLAMTRPAPGPDGLRRPLWFDRPLRPVPAASQGVAGTIGFGGSRHWYRDETRFWRLRRRRRDPAARPRAFAAASQPSTPVAFAVPPGRMRLPHPRLRRSAAVSVCAGTRLHARAGVGRRDARAPPRAAHGSRRHRPAERLRHRQRLHARRHPAARRARQGRGGDRRPARRTRRSTRCIAAAFRGVRLNLATAGVTDPGRRPAGASATPASGSRGAPWHIQLNTDLAMIDALHAQFAARRRCRSCSTISAARRRRSARSSRASTTLVDLVRSGKAYIKISGAYRSLDARPRLRGRGAAGAGADRGERCSGSCGEPTGRIPTRRRSPADRCRPTSRRSCRSTTAACSISWRSGRLIRPTRKAILVDNPASGSISSDAPVLMPGSGRRAERGACAPRALGRQPDPARAGAAGAGSGACGASHPGFRPRVDLRTARSALARTRSASWSPANRRRWASACPEHAVGLVGHTARALGSVTGRRVEWRVLGRGGATARAAARSSSNRRRRSTRTSSSIILGVSDTLGFSSPARLDHVARRAARVRFAGDRAARPWSRRGSPDAALPRAAVAAPAGARVQSLRARSRARSRGRGARVAVAHVPHAFADHAEIPEIFCEDGFHPLRHGLRALERRHSRRRARRSLLRRSRSCLINAVAPSRCQLYSDRCATPPPEPFPVRSRLYLTGNCAPTAVRRDAL